MKLGKKAKELMKDTTEIYSKQSIKKSSMKYGESLRWLPQLIMDKHKACDIKDNGFNGINVIRHFDKAQFVYRTIKELKNDINNNWI